MLANKLTVVAALSNPIRWNSRRTLYKAFEQHMLDSGVKLTVVECTFGEREPEALPTSAHVNHVHVRANAGALVWSKENLINIGVQRSPDARYIATVDADITFRRPDWASETVEALQHYHVVQPWSDCYDLGPYGEHIDLHRSFCRLVHEKKPIVQGPNAINGPYRFGHPGYAWAYTRQALEWLGGLPETAALGAADHHCAMALINRVDESIPGNISESYKVPLRLWQARANANIHQNIGYVPGTIEHSWHGPKKQRYYVERWDTLIRHNFDPATDLKKNTWGVVELAGNKAGLRHDIDLYYRSRNEDLNGE